MEWFQWTANPWNWFQLDIMTLLDFLGRMKGRFSVFSGHNPICGWINTTGKSEGNPSRSCGNFHWCSMIWRWKRWHSHKVGRTNSSTPLFQWWHHLPGIFSRNWCGRQSYVTLINLNHHVQGGPLPVIRRAIAPQCLNLGFRVRVFGTHHDLGAIGTEAVFSWHNLAGISVGAQWFGGGIDGSTYRGYFPSYPFIKPFIEVLAPFITEGGVTLLGWNDYFTILRSHVNCKGASSQKKATANSFWCFKWNYDDVLSHALS